MPSAALPWTLPGSEPRLPRPVWFPLAQPGDGMRARCLACDLRRNERVFAIRIATRASSAMPRVERRGAARRRRIGKAVASLWDGFIRSVALPQPRNRGSELAGGRCTLRMLVVSKPRSSWLVVRAAAAIGRPLCFWSISASRSRTRVERARLILAMAKRASPGVPFGCDGAPCWRALATTPLHQCPGSGPPSTG